MSNLMENMENKIKQFIKNKEVCVLATYIVTSSQSTKIKNIKMNPNVSVAIDDQGRQERACLQAEGIAKILKGVEEEQARRLYSQKRKISHHKPELVDTILKIELKEIMFTDYVEESLRVFRFRLDE